ncbi:MAG TPA: KUP/HAK/KT family potassium transporter [Candidatus Limnocylindrales bacterium]|nr:KUP/HAK/KT family potassium transporter [Candidatus Limnocylindrales bacterium]
MSSDDESSVPELREGPREPSTNGSRSNGHAVNGARPLERRTLHEAAHKLGQRVYPDSDSKEVESEAVRRRFDALNDGNRDVIAHAGRAVLALGALGVVYGDIGTSPLYTEQVIFTAHRAAAQPNVAGVYGIVSLIFWALMIVVSIKYAGFIMRAHNRGDGGIMALAALLRRNRVAHGAALVTLGIFGAALFFGDGIITPSISVLGSVQGLKVVSPALSHLVVPVSVAILIALFFLQRRGSGAIGWLFGPVILVWFVAIGLLGLSQVVKDPSVLQALSPTWGARFLVNNGVAGYLALGGVVLAVTGAEALYADRGHFGAAPIRLGWFGVALPALMLNYMGQGVLIMHDPSAAANPFYLMVPGWGQYPMLFLATAATIIASQAAISGSFSVARQAMQLGFLPRLTIRHPSKVEGQIYVPIVNWALCLGVVALTLVFQSADRLGDIYGVAVTATFVLNTVLFLAVAHYLWRTSSWKLALVATLFLTVELAFFSANIAKIEHGAWLSLAIAFVLSLVMVNWRRGQVVVTRKRTKKEGPLTEFLEGLPAKDPPIVRVPGVAVFLNPCKETTPLALRAEVEYTNTFHERVLIASVDQVSLPQVEDHERFTVERLGGPFTVWHVTVRVGYQEKLNVPAALKLCRRQGLLERGLDLEHAKYFLSRITIAPTDASPLRLLRKRLFIAMARNAASPVEAFRLPRDSTMVVGSQVTL